MYTYEHVFRFLIDIYFSLTSFYTRVLCGTIIKEFLGKEFNKVLSFVVKNELQRNSFQKFFLILSS